MTTALGIFGRAPVAGKAKTRLIPALGAEGAASLYAAMLEDVLRTARRLPGFALTFWSADDTQSRGLETLLAEVPRRVQCEGDLGRRMEHALAWGCAAHGRALLVGSDAPTVPGRHLLQAAEALLAVDAVVGPAEDGGYYLIGARRVVPGMLEGVRFSSAHTRHDTERSLRAAGLSLAHVAGWRDVDTPADLERLRSQLADQPALAPATARWLANDGPRG